MVYSMIPFSSLAEVMAMDTTGLPFSAFRYLASELRTRVVEKTCCMPAIRREFMANASYREYIWKSIHAAEFFHGTVEMTDKNMSFMLFKGEDETRPLVDRVENFVRKYSDVVQVWDTRDYPLEGIDADMRKYVSPMVMSTQLERVSAHFEHVKDHSLDIRRYYRTVEY